MTKEKVFAEGQHVLNVADYVRRGMAGPSKFTPKWEGPFVIREAHQSGYYRLNPNGWQGLDGSHQRKMVETLLCLRKKKLCGCSFICFVKSFYVSFTLFFFFPSSDYVTTQNIVKVLS